jgi:hypothetical protein
MRDISYSYCTADRKSKTHQPKIQLWKTSERELPNPLNNVTRTRAIQSHSSVGLWLFYLN